MSQNQKELLVLGIDPGLRYTGWALINTKRELIAFGLIQNDCSNLITNSLLHIHNSLKEILSLYIKDYYIECNIEQIFVNSNKSSSLSLAYARGVIIMTIAMHCIEVLEYSATSIKKTITGYGHATKTQVKEMIHRFIPSTKNIDAKHDVFDAIAIALCHPYVVW